MNNYFYHISNAFKLFFWALKNPEILDQNVFKMLSDLLAMILKVSTEDRHYVTHIASVHPEKNDKQIVSIWAGAGVGAEPIMRIEELREENAILRAEIAQIVKQQHP